MPLSRDDVAHIASLVRLGMSEDEIETLRVELSDILEQFETLSAVDTTDVPPTAHQTGDVSDVVAAERHRKPPEEVARRPLYQRTLSLSPCGRD